MDRFHTELRRYRVTTPLTVNGDLQLAQGVYPGIVEWTVIQELGGPVESERRYILRLGRKAYAQAGGTEDLRSLDVVITEEVRSDEIEVIGSGPVNYSISATA